MAPIPGFLFIDHIAVAVPPDELEAQIASCPRLGFREMHGEDVLGSDRVLLRLCVFG